MAVETSRFDAAEYLETPQDIAHYLEAVFEDGDPALIAEALGNIARARGMTAIARKAGITREALYKSLSSSGDPKLSTFIRVLDAIGLRLRAVADH